MLLIFYLQASSAIWSISCGIDCQMNFGFMIVAILTGLYLLLLIVSAGLDMKVSRFLHRRKHRMSTQELRQEQRDHYGSPEMKGAQRSFRDELTEESPAQQNKANLIIHSDNVVHALHFYMSGQAVIVQTAGPDLLKSAKAAGVYCIKNDMLANQLSQYPQGKLLPSEISMLIQQAISTAGHQ